MFRCGGEGAGCGGCVGGGEVCRVPSRSLAQRWSTQPCGGARKGALVGSHDGEEVCLL